MIDNITKEERYLMNREESTYFHLSDNVSNLVYHFVCPAKLLRSVFSDNVEEHLFGDRVQI